MIVRILGEAQYELDEEARPRLEQLDQDLGHAITANDEAWFHKALTAVLAEVREAGTPLEPSRIVPSDLALPSSDSSLQEVRTLLESDQA
ncbi:MAG: hypothetical protein JWM85_2091 [Acidimicrobiaceae bacterium]|nr:hypothetical protein [Acidimicrobiaceae bacterium]